MIVTAEKLVREIKSISDHTPMKLLRRAMLAKYEELRGQFPANQFTRDGFVEGSAADQAFARWYSDIRKGRIRDERVSFERMQIHARWHLRNVFLQQRNTVKHVPIKHQPRKKRVKAA